MTAPTARPAAPPTGRPTVGSLFSGIGGLDLGLERTGWEVRWQVEIDDYCRRVLAKHWPDVPKFGDIRTVTGGELERVDLVCGGFPCQDVSGAGRRAGIGGERSGLWGEYARLLRVVRPRLVLVENVTGLLDRGMGVVLRDLAALGFDAEWSVLSACAFGAPHSRERVFIVAYPNGERRGHGSHPVSDHAIRDGRQWEAAQAKSQWRDMERWLGATVAAGDWHEPSAPVCGVADGLPTRVERLRGLGNAVVPQVAEWIGRRLLEAMA